MQASTKIFRGGSALAAGLLTAVALSACAGPDYAAYAPYDYYGYGPAYDYGPDYYDYGPTVGIDVRGHDHHENRRGAHRDWRGVRGDWHGGWGQQQAFARSGGRGGFTSTSPRDGSGPRSVRVSPPSGGGKGRP